MDWCPLPANKIEDISKLIDYSGKDMRAGELYRRIASIPYCMEDKVKFILRYWGWDGKLKKDGIQKIKEVEELGFCFPDNAYTCIGNLYGLKMITMTRSSLGEIYNGTLIFELPPFISNDLDYALIRAEILGVKYQNTIMPVGHHTNKHKDDDIVFLSEQGEIYEIDPAYSEYSQIVEDNLTDYLAIRFGLKIWEENQSSIDVLSEEDYDILDHIEKLFSQCEYKQGQFRKGPASNS